jgi:hypothetical protein
LINPRKPSLIQPGGTGNVEVKPKVEVILAYSGIGPGIPDMIAFAVA